MDEQTVESVDPHAQVSHEVDGRILTGVGASVDALAETMERHAEEPPAASAPESKPAASPARDDAGKFQRQSRGQRRFDELTREREDARREAADAKRERDEIRARYEASQRADVRTQQPAGSTGASAQQRENTPGSRQDGSHVSTRPRPIEDEVGTKYQSYGDYVEDLADWKAEQRLTAFDFDARVRQGIEADRASRSFQQTVEQTIAKARETIPDFDATLKSGPGVHVPIGDGRPARILALPNAAQIMYAIAKDAEFATRLARMDDFEFGVALAQLAPAQAVANPASTPAVGSPVIPQPYQPVGAGTKTTAIPSSELARKSGFDFDKSGYREKRAQERGMRR